MTTKFVALISVIALAAICVVQAQSPTPAESPAASPAEKAASPSPAESPAASPKAKPTPKKAKPTPTPRPAASPAPGGRVTEEAVNPPAPGGGQGQVWVNTETGIYHRQGSRLYGTTRKGKYMTEQDAKQAGYKPAPTRR
jgi:pyruvate/2-oxoglutarate dehydrogenase complex dihydrolipoamide acyltransferase (E2) component